MSCSHEYFNFDGKTKGCGHFVCVLGTEKLLGTVSHCQLLTPKDKTQRSQMSHFHSIVIIPSIFSVGTPGQDKFVLLLWVSVLGSCESSQQAACGIPLHRAPTLPRPRGSAHQNASTKLTQLHNFFQPYFLSQHPEIDIKHWG